MYKPGERPADSTKTELSEENVEAPPDQQATATDATLEQTTEETQADQ